MDASLRRIELLANPAFRQNWELRLQGRPLPLDDGPVAVRWRAQRLYPCLHPGIPPQSPLQLQLVRGGGVEAQWQLEADSPRFAPVPPSTDASSAGEPEPYPRTGCSLDLRWHT